MFTGMSGWNILDNMFNQVAEDSNDLHDKLKHHHHDVGDIGIDGRGDICKPFFNLFVN